MTSEMLHELADLFDRESLDSFNAAPYRGADFAEGERLASIADEIRERVARGEG